MHLLASAHADGVMDAGELMQSRGAQVARPRPPRSA